MQNSWRTRAGFRSLLGAVGAAILLGGSDRSVGEDRFLEVVEVETIRTPSVHLALVGREVSQLTQAVERHRKLVRRAEDAANSAPDTRKNIEKGKAARARRELRQAEGRVKRAQQEATSIEFRPLTIAHCWDGFAKSPVDVWFLEEDKLMLRLKVGDIMEAELDPTALRVMGESGSMSIQGLVVAKGRVLRKVPQGFMRQRLSQKTMPWETHAAPDLEKIRASIAESPIASKTMLRLRLDPPDATDLVAITFRVFALDENGNVDQELTDPNGLAERNLATGSIVTFLDPGRRFAHGYKVTIESASYRGRIPSVP